MKNKDNKEMNNKDNKIINNLPLYIYHEQVKVVKIKKIVPIIDEIKNKRIDTISTVLIIPENNDAPSFHVDAEYLNKYNPKPGGYFILYKDGCQSYFSKEDFEDRYNLFKHSEVNNG